MSKFEFGDTSGFDQGEPNEGIVGQTPDETPSDPYQSLIDRLKGISPLGYIPLDPRFRSGELHSDDPFPMRRNVERFNKIEPIVYDPWRLETIEQRNEDLLEQNYNKIGSKTDGITDALAVSAALERARQQRIDDEVAQRNAEREVEERERLQRIDDVLARIEAEERARLQRIADTDHYALKRWQDDGRSQREDDHYAEKRRSERLIDKSPLKDFFKP